MNRFASSRSRSSPSTPLSLGSLLKHPIIIVAWMLFCVIAGIQLVRSGLKARSVLEKKEDVQEQLQKEEQKGMELIQTLEEAKSEEAQERMIREELRMQKPGEIILQVPTPSPIESAN